MQNELQHILFFFQAEDGIRDKLVTGVQTCALPISEHGNAVSFEGGGPRHSGVVRHGPEPTLDGWIEVDCSSVDTGRSFRGCLAPCMLALANTSGNRRRAPPVRPRAAPLPVKLASVEQRCLPAKWLGCGSSGGPSCCP